MGAGTVMAVSAAIVMMAACTEGQASGTRARAPVVDSAVTIDEALRRFREGRVEPAGLGGGATSREDLVEAFLRALERRDTAALRPLVLDAAEFAWLYYPSSPMSRAPYELPPDVLWLQLQGQSERGASLLLAERAGMPLGVLRHECGSERTEGDNRIYGRCVLWRVTASGDTVGERLFGLIVERGGVYKFVSYANRLD